MTREEIIQQTGGFILRPLGIIQSLLIIGLLISPILWIWVSWTIAWKVALTCLIGIIMITIVYYVVKGIIGNTVDMEIQKMNKKPLSFKERLDDKIKEVSK